MKLFSFIFFLYFRKWNFLAPRLIYFWKWNFIPPGIKSSYNFSKKGFSYASGGTPKSQKPKFPTILQKKVMNKLS